MPLSSGVLIDRTRAGFQLLSLDTSIKLSAITYLKDWLEHDKFAHLLDNKSSNYRPLLEWMITSERFDLLLDSFYQSIPFGTGGRRGPVGIGPNRINPYTIASSVQGHVEYLRLRFPRELDLKVVIAFDVRQYSDLRQHYPPDVPNPVLGLSSKDLAHTAASVYCAAGVTVCMLPEEVDGYLSTPELSFLIRRLGAHGGLNVSASHNHPDDNGGKFYNSCGGQEIPPYDEEMVKIVETITDVKSMPYARALKTGLIRPIDNTSRRKYVDLNLNLCLRSDPGDAKIVYTPLHGTGRDTVGRCLQAVGFEKGKQFFPVENQCSYRGDFVNVKFRIPNPEVPESMDQAIDLAKEVDADLVLATDPDADRIGAAVPWGNDFVFVSGNELAAILTRYRLESLQRAAKLPKTPLIIKTHVTTNLVTRIAESFSARVIGDLLVGFKYVGDILNHLERTGKFAGVTAHLNDFVLAAEESHGLLVTPEVRDKDAAGAAVLLAELAADLKQQDSSVYRYLIEIYKRYGYHQNSLRSTIMQGAAGKTAISRIQEALRTNPPDSVAGLRVVSVEDYWDESTFGFFKSETDRSSRDLLTITVEGGLRVVVRPSGTEPKNKIYIEKRSEPLGSSASDEQFYDVRRKVDNEILTFSNAFVKSMLELINVELPDYALKISDLVSLEKKCLFVEKFIPDFELQAKAFMNSATTAQAVNEWIDAQLVAYGPDARLLLARAMRSYLAAETSRSPDKEGVLAEEGKLFFGKYSLGYGRQGGD